MKKTTGPNRPASPLESLGDARHVFDEYREKRAPNTLRRQKADLDLLRQFLWSFYVVPPSDFHTEPESWRDVTWGLIEAFRRWQLDQGYAIPSINVRLATVKKYAGLAFKAGVISPEEHALIRTVTGYTPHERQYIDQERLDKGQAIRKSGKKTSPTPLSSQAVHALKNKQPDSPQGRRDSLLMCLLLDHGLRCSELAGLKAEQLNRLDHTLTFERPKITKSQIHQLSRDTQRALAAYIEQGDYPAKKDTPLLRASNKTGQLIEGGMSSRAISKRVNILGAALGIPQLSAQDGRHSWATRAAKHGTDPFALQEAGGWTSLAMPRRYIQESEIANAGVKLE